MGDMLLRLCGDNGAPLADLPSSGWEGFLSLGCRSSWGTCAHRVRPLFQATQWLPKDLQPSHKSGGHGVVEAGRTLI